MVRDDHQHGRRIVGELLFCEARHHAVDGFKRRIGFCAKRAMIVLRFVERAKVQGHESRLKSAQNLESIACLGLVTADRGVVAIHVRAGCRLQLFYEHVGAGKRGHQQLVVGIRRTGNILPAPVLGNQPVDGGADAHRPAHARRTQAGAVRRIPQCRHANLRRIPVPGAAELLERIEDLVVGDAVLGGPYAGEQRGVAGISDRRPDADHAFGISAVAQQSAEVGNLHAVLVGMGDVLRLEAINGDHQHRCGVGARGKGEGQQQKKCEESGESACGRDHAECSQVDFGWMRIMPAAILRTLARRQFVCGESIQKTVRRSQFAGTSGTHATRAKKKGCSREQPL